MSKKVDSRGRPTRSYTTHRRVASTSFAAVLLIIVGVLHVLQGLSALLSEGDYTTAKGYFLGTDGSKWGWAHLALGVAAVVAGAALRGRADWARGVAVVVATLSMFAAFLWLPYNAAGAIVILALDFFVMWAAFADLDRNAP